MEPPAGDHDSLETALREETGAAGGPPPGLATGQIRWTHQTVFLGIGREMLAGRKPAEVSREVLVLAEDIEDLLSEKVLNYAVRGVQ